MALPPPPKSSSAAAAREVDLKIELEKSDNLTHVLTGLAAILNIDAVADLLPPSARVRCKTGFRFDFGGGCNCLQ
jgi:hypothetical protein